MNSYIDETSKEEFTEDITIREALRTHTKPLLMMKPLH